MPDAMGHGKSVHVTVLYLLLTCSEYFCTCTSTCRQEGIWRDSPRKFLSCITATYKYRYPKVSLVWFNKSFLDHLPHHQNRRNRTKLLFHVFLVIFAFKNSDYTCSGTWKIFSNQATATREM